jgi:excisionase family DNA binding protein
MTTKIKAKTVCETPLLYPRAKAACQLGISTRALDHLIAGKKIRAQRIGKRVLIHSKELTRFASANHYDPVDKKNASPHRSRVRPCVSLSKRAFGEIVGRDFAAHQTLPTRFE